MFSLLVSELITQEQIAVGAVEHVICRVWQLTYIKRSKVKVTRSCMSSKNAKTSQRMVVSASNWVEISIVRGETRDTLCRSVGQVGRK